MIYHVQARFKSETAKHFLTKLTDGTIAAQRPDGPELVAAMDRAVVGDEGQVEWSELCYCTPPLAHERETVLDLHFEEIQTEPIDEHATYKGQLFMEHLKVLSEC